MRLASGWGRWLAAATAVLTTLAVGTSVVAADGVRDGPPGPCDGRPQASGGTGSWYRLDGVLSGGTLVGQTAIIGRADGTGWTLRLAPEGFVAAPLGGLVVVGSDDGRRSTLTVVDAIAGCAWSAAASSDIVRGAVLAPDGRSWFEHRLRREDRADLGVWRRDAPDDPGRRVLPPLAPDERFGITWSTRLGWDVDGRRLVVQTCGEVACRTRILDPETGGVQAVSDPELGASVGLVGDALVVRGACRGLPCPVVAVDVDDGSRRSLSDGAGLATVVAAGQGDAFVVVETDPTGGRLRALDVDDGTPVDLGALDSAARLVTASSGSGAALPIGAVLVAPDGRVPRAGSTGGEVRRVSHPSDVSVRRTDPPGSRP
jgi:hypothetical protein